LDGVHQQGVVVVLADGLSHLRIIQAFAGEGGRADLFP
jgi:hypothetical protein